MLDDFCKVYQGYEKEKLLPKKQYRKRLGRMNLSEMLTIIIMYQRSEVRNFKRFYKLYIEGVYKEELPKRISYNRFIELMPRLMLPLTVLLHTLLGGEKWNVFY